MGIWIACLLSVILLPWFTSTISPNTFLLLLVIRIIYMAMNLFLLWKGLDPSPQFFQIEIALVILGFLGILFWVFFNDELLAVVEPFFRWVMSLLNTVVLLSFSLLTFRLLQRLFHLLNGHHELLILAVLLLQLFYVEQLLCKSFLEFVVKWWFVRFSRLLRECRFMKRFFYWRRFLLCLLSPLLRTTFGWKLFVTCLFLLILCLIDILGVFFVKSLSFQFFSVNLCLHSLWLYFYVFLTIC